MDPRVKTPLAGLQEQFKLSEQLYTQLLALSPAAEEAAAVRKQLKEAQKSAQGDALAAVNALDQKLQTLAGGGGRRPGAGAEAPSLGGLKTRYLALLNVFQEVDDAPTTQAASAVAELEKQLAPVMHQWDEIKAKDIPALNQQLKKAGMPEVKMESALQAAKATVSSRDKDEE
jgi:hypothetical protein